MTSAKHSMSWMSESPTRGSSARSQTSVFVVADVRIYREGLAESLSTHPQLTVLGTSASRADAREQVRQLRPHVVLIDIATRESLELIGGHFARVRPIPKVLALAVVEGECADVIECAEAGASGYVSAEASMDDLVKAIERITELGSSYVLRKSRRSCSAASRTASRCQWDRRSSPAVARQGTQLHPPGQFKAVDGTAQKITGARARLRWRGAGDAHRDH